MQYSDMDETQTDKIEENKLSNLSQDNPGGPLSRSHIEELLSENGERYRDQIHKTTFRTRNQGLFAGGGLGLFLGAFVGAIAVASTAIVGVSLAAMFAMLPIVLGAFAIAGAVVGAAWLIDVDNTTGVVVGAEKVRDRKQFLQNNVKALEETIRYHGGEPEPKTFWNRIIPFTEGSVKIFNVNNALKFGAVGLVIAVILSFIAAATPLGSLAVIAGIHGVVLNAIAAHTTAATTALATKAATALTAKALTCMTVATCGTYGALFGLDLPVISANAVKFVANIFSDKPYESNEAHVARLKELVMSVKQQQENMQIPAPALEKVTSEDMQKINELTKAGTNSGKNYQQIITTQQMQPSSTVPR